MHAVSVHPFTKICRFCQPICSSSIMISFLVLASIPISYCLYCWLLILDIVHLFQHRLRVADHEPIWCIQTEKFQPKRFSPSKEKLSYTYSNIINFSYEKIFPTLLKKPVLYQTKNFLYLPKKNLIF